MLRGIVISTADAVHDNDNNANEHVAINHLNDKRERLLRPELPQIRIKPRSRSGGSALLLFSAPGATGIQSLGRLGRQSAEGLVASLTAHVNPENSGDDQAVRSSGEFGDAFGAHAWEFTPIGWRAPDWSRALLIPGRRSNSFPLARTNRERAEIRFDMFEADLTHEGDRCIFEVLAAEVESKSPALRAIAEIVS
jgi:hypothetical protein